MQWITSEINKNIIWEEALDKWNSLAIFNELVGEMGFDWVKVFNLLMYESDNIPMNDIQAAVDMMIKGPNGYTHRYWISETSDIEDGKLCCICGEAASEHVGYGMNLDDELLDQPIEEHKWEI